MTKQDFYMWDCAQGNRGWIIFIWSLDVYTFQIAFKTWRHGVPRNVVFFSPVISPDPTLSVLHTQGSWLLFRYSYTLSTKDLDWVSGRQTSQQIHGCCGVFFFFSFFRFNFFLRVFCKSLRSRCQNVPVIAAAGISSCCSWLRQARLIALLHRHKKKPSAPLAGEQTDAFEIWSLWYQICNISTRFGRGDNWKCACLICKINLPKLSN